MIIRISSHWTAKFKHLRQRLSLTNKWSTIGADNLISAMFLSLIMIVWDGLKLYDFLYGQP